MIGDDIRRLREEMGMSQADLAKKLSISDKTVSSWEVNRTEPKFEGIKECRNSNRIVRNILNIHPSIQTLKEYPQNLYLSNRKPQRYLLLRITKWFFLCLNA